MHKQVAYLALVQGAVVVLGCCAVAMVLDVSGYPDRPDPRIRWTPLAVLLLHYGPWLLLVPAAWAVYALASSHVERGLLSESPAAAMGVLILLALLIAFTYSACQPYTRMMRL
jgi:hypothetical protein